MSRLDDAFSADRFRALGHKLVDRLADHLAAASSRSEAMPVLPLRSPDEAATRWPSTFSPTGDGALLDVLERAIDESNHLHHPRYAGHQVTAPLPDAALGELVGALLNNSMAVFEMGPAATAMERALVAFLARALGWAADADGVLTSGGSLGNLTALLAMRAARAADADPRTLAVLVSAQAHYSIRRATTMMGWGRGGTVAVPVDERHRLRVDAIDDAVLRAERDGRRVVAVVASACSTATGAFDPIDAIAEHCDARGLWLHVDGAHGAAAALSPLHRHLLAGVERADSVVWDAHKMMLMPSLVTAVLFREGARSYATFEQQASYLFTTERPWSDVALRTVECTKRMMSLPLYAALATHGPALFTEYVERTFARAASFAESVRRSADFELAVQPQCNIVCFRHTPAGARDLDALQSALRRAVVDSGRFYLVQTGLPAGTFLRVTIINPRTTDDDLDALLDALRAAARSL